MISWTVRLDAEDRPLTEEEQAAVDDGVAALEALIERLADVPTPDGGPPPRERPVRTLPVLGVAGPQD